MVVVDNVKRFFSARLLSLGLILFLAGVMYVSTLIPQRIDAVPAELEMWRFRHGGLLWLVDFFHLHSVYAQPWFAAAILSAAVALAISAITQLALARKKLFATATTSTDEVAAGVAGMSLRAVARKNHYQLLGVSPDGQLKFVRNPWGYFGNPLLHLGITVVITMSLYVALTTRQGTLILVEGEQQANNRSWAVSEQGVFATPLELPGTIRLDRVKVQLDSRQQPLDVSSELSLIEPSGQVHPLTASINRMLNYHGLRIYHAAQYGNAFAVSFTDKNGTVHAETVAAHHPPTPAEAGYSDDFAVNWSSNLLSAKYYVNADKQSQSGGNPELTLRMTQAGRELARTTVTTGKTGMLGEYKVKLHGVSQWAKLTVVDSRGMPLLFTGFAVIMLGGLLRYLMPPRELIAIRQQHDCYTVFWKAGSFRDFYLEERDRLTMALQRENTT
jgi:cytochrome c biogenesis protein ResB